MDRTLTDWLTATLGFDSQVEIRLLYSAAVIVAVILLRRLFLFVLFRRVEDVRLRYNWSKASAYAATVIAIVALGRIWFEGLASLWTFFGLLGAGLAIALRDLVADLAGWGFIVWRRPFEVGDRIQIGEHAGDVIDIRLFQFTVLETGNWVEADQSTGRILHVPNAKVLSDALANYTRGFPYIWNEMKVLVTFESDWRRAKELLLEVARRHSEGVVEDMRQRVQEAARRFLIYYPTLTPTVYTSVRESGVLLTIRYLTEARKRRGTEQAIWEDVLAAFAAEPEIDFAYPTWRFYDHAREGKEALRPGEPVPGAGPPL